MKLIIGGAFQGKLEYARTQYGLADGWIDGADCVPEAIEGCRGIFHFEAWVRRLLQEHAEEGQAWELTVERFAGTVAERLYEKNPELIVKIVKSISSAIQKPLTVKVRIGFENEPVDIVEIAKRVEDAGAAAIAVHGRTRQQYYSGIADWETIARVKEAVSIPVIGNGDVDSPKKAEKLFRQTGCDAVMIGRAVEGNPWIFREMNHYFATGEELARPSLAEVKAMILKHARAQIEMKGEFIGIREMRKHVAWYTAGMPHSAGLRRESNNIESYADLEKLLERL